jgi:threonine/homoserine/homoserine lactone efflux protein
VPETLPLFLLKGLVIGFSIAAPVGPIGVLCIRRSLRDGAWMGFMAGLGAATADAAYGCVAGFGLTAVSGFLVGHRQGLAFAGGAFLLYLGARTFLSGPATGPAAEGEGRPRSVYASTLVLTLTNPATIISFTAVFASFGVGLSSSYLPASLLVLGVFLGSAAWWFILSSAAGTLRTRVDSGWMRTVNRVSGATLLAFGLFALYHALR